MKTDKLLIDDVFTVDVFETEELEMLEMPNSDSQFEQETNVDHDYCFNTQPQDVLTKIVDVIQYHNFRSWKPCHTGGSALKQEAEAFNNPPTFAHTMTIEVPTSKMEIKWEHFNNPGDLCRNFNNSMGQEARDVNKTNEHCSERNKSYHETTIGAATSKVPQKDDLKNVIPETLNVQVGNEFLESENYLSNQSLRVNSFETEKPLDISIKKMQQLIRNSLSQEVLIPPMEQDESESGPVTFCVMPSLDTGDIPGFTMENMREQIMTGCYNDISRLLGISNDENTVGTFEEQLTDDVQTFNHFSVLGTQIHPVDFSLTSNESKLQGRRVHKPIEVKVETEEKLQTSTVGTHFSLASNELNQASSEKNKYNGRRIHKPVELEVNVEELETLTQVLPISLSSLDQNQTSENCSDSNGNVNLPISSISSRPQSIENSTPSAISSESCDNSVIPSRSIAKELPENLSPTTKKSCTSSVQIATVLPTLETDKKKGGTPKRSVAPNMRQRLDDQASSSINSVTPSSVPEHFPGSIVPPSSVPEQFPGSIVPPAANSCTGSVQIATVSPNLEAAKKRGRPKGSLNKRKRVDDQNQEVASSSINSVTLSSVPKEFPGIIVSPVTVANSCTGSVQIATVSPTLEAIKKKRGRPKGSPNKKQRLDNPFTLLVGARRRIEGMIAPTVPATGVLPEASSHLQNSIQAQINCFMEIFRQKHQSNKVVKPQFCTLLNDVLKTAAFEQPGFIASLSLERINEVYTIIGEFLNGVTYFDEEPTSMAGAVGRAYAAKYGQRRKKDHTK